MSGLLNDLQWIAGDEAAENGTSLASSMHEAIISEVNRITGKSYPFCPWMSQTERAKELEFHFERAYPGEAQTNRFILNRLQKDLQGKNGYLNFGFDEGLNIKFDIECEKNQPHFVQRFNASREVLFQILPWISKLYQSLVKEVLPIVSESSDEFDRIGASSHAAKGALFFQLPPSDRDYAVEQTAIDLAHEIGHQLLQVYISADPILSSEQTAQIYSGARDDVRDAIRSFHGAMAHVYESVTAVALWNRKREHTQETSQFLAFTICDLNSRLGKTLSGLSEYCTFTEIGHMMMTELLEYHKRLTKLVSSDVLLSKVEITSFFQEVVSE